LRIIHNHYISPMCLFCLSQFMLFSGFKINKKIRLYLSNYRFLTIISIFLLIGLFLNTNIPFAQEFNNQQLLEERYFYLAKGINAGGWFSRTFTSSDDFKSRFTIKDLQLIKKMGFRHVRLPLDPDLFFNKDHPEKISVENIKYLDIALDMILRQDLAVIVDLHPNLKSEFNRRLYSDEVFIDDIAKFWRSLAQHLSKYNSERVFFEVLNEPSFENPQKWNAIQPHLLSAMRAGAPKHTLIAAANQRVGNNWDQVTALETLETVKDRNVVYNFHFYSPMEFTHQGADWVWKDLTPYFKHVPYPSSSPALASLLPSIKNEVVREQLKNYGKQQWNAKKLEGLISRASAWSKSHKVQLTCNEFGVYRVVASPEDRITWIRDVRSLLEKYEIGWSMWDFSGDFGVTIKINREAAPDIKTLQALFDRN
jgi:endoglucanase